LVRHGIVWLNDYDETTGAEHVKHVCFIVILIDADALFDIEFLSRQELTCLSKSAIGNSYEQRGHSSIFFFCVVLRGSWSAQFSIWSVKSWTSIIYDQCGHLLTSRLTFARCDGSSSSHSAKWSANLFSSRIAW